MSAQSSPARWWHAIENQKVVCRLCPRECHIPRGSRGFCFVRANVDGRLELTTYGRSSGFCIDPIEKKPLNHFLPGTPILSFGTAGCNLGCKFCQNWDISKSRETDTLAHEATPEAIVAAALRTGCRSLAFTYNDPVIWAEYAIDIAKVAHAAGLKTVAVTAGYISKEARGEFYQHMDAANVDLKAFTDFFYSKLCQVNLDPILDTLEFLKRETNVWFELTNLMIPGENDSTEETKQMCGWIVEHLGPDVPLHFTAFHPDFKMRDTPRTPPETLVQARQIARAAGIRHAFVGNVNDVANQSTYCHACGKMLIERDWYVLGAYNLRGNACGHCGAKIPGVFDAAGPGTWGNKRVPIIIGGETNSLVQLRTPMKNESTAAGGGLNVVGTRAEPVRFAGAQPDMAARGGTGLQPQAPVPQVEFTPGQDSQILSYTRALVESHVNGELFTKARLPEPLAQAPAFGLFVSLFRGKQLRSCKGQWGTGTLMPLGQMLATVARDAAANDPRFPRIAAAELPHLMVEVSLMHNPQAMVAVGADRVRAVEVGKHGLVIMHPRGGGLLLPHVATEAGWDAGAFLEGLCQKAGLPPGTWRDAQAKLVTFFARKITLPAPAPDLDVQALGAAGLEQLLRFAQQSLPGQAMPPEAGAMPALHRVNPEELGICLQTASGASGAAIQPGQRLLALAQLAAQSLAQNLRERGVAEPVARMTMLWQPMPLAAADYPARHRHLPPGAIVARHESRWSLTAAQGDGRTDPIAQALAGLGQTPEQWRADTTRRITVTAFQMLQCQAAGPATPSAAAPGPQVRSPHCAGGFYPAEPERAIVEVDGYLRAGGRGQTAAQRWRGVMLPHAGWRFCGGTMGKTLAGVAVPRIVIFVGPKHTPFGPAASVASHVAWDIPGASVPVARGIVERLCRQVPGLACESEAHRQEHGTEVLLPFLLRLRPDVQIVPIALGGVGGDFIGSLARALAGIVSAGAEAERPLLVISSDMNHFASEEETRRRDGLALEALRSGDPRRLFDTCMNNDISMCGLLPAVVVMQALLMSGQPLAPRVVDYSTSAAASGDTARVVGYAGAVIA